jgi:hypothetical protein
MKKRQLRNIALPPGQIVTPLPGMTHWDRKGRALGVWGVDFPISFMVDIGNGDVRKLTEAETKLAERIYGPLPGRRGSKGGAA